MEENAPLKETNEFERLETIFPGLFKDWDIAKKDGIWLAMRWITIRDENVTVTYVAEVTENGTLFIHQASNKFDSGLELEFLDERGDPTEDAMTIMFNLYDVFAAKKLVDVLCGLVSGGSDMEQENLAYDASLKMYYSSLGKYTELVEKYRKAHGDSDELNELIKSAVRSGKDMGVMLTIESMLNKSREMRK